MAATLKTYLVISATPVVVENPVFASSTSYQPGDTFQELDNNVSVQRLLADGLIAEVTEAPNTAGFVVVTGETGPAGPTGPGASNDLAITLSIGNVTGGTDILLTGGDKIMGGRACFGSSTAAVADGDLAAAAGSNEFSWNGATGDLSATDGTRTLGYTGASGQLDISGIDATVDAVLVTGSADGDIDISLTNSSAGTAARARLLLAGDAGDGSLAVHGSGHAVDADSLLLSAHSGLSGGVVVSADGAAPISMRTNGIQRWQISSTGHLIPSADNAYDIGVAGTNRVRDVVVRNSVRVGLPLGLTDAGDIRASDGVRELFWDASEGLLRVDNLEVSGTTTIINTEIQTADNYVLLNSEYTLDTPQSSGLVMNVDPAATSFSISDITSNVITVAAGDPSAVLSAGDFILVQDPATAANAGVYEVLSTTTSTITIDTTPSEVFSGSGLTDDATTQGTVVGVGLAVWEASTTGVFQRAFGTTAPLTRDVQLGAGYLAVGGSITPSTGDGDIVAGDGTNSFTYDASNDLFAVGEFTNPSTVSITESAVRLFGTGSCQAVRRDAATNSVSTNISAYHASTGTPLAGFGVGALFVAEDNTNVNNEVGSLDFRWEVNPATSRDSELRIGLCSAGTGSTGNTAGVWRGSDLTLRINGGLEVGGATGTVTGAGDIVAGDGTREMSYDASTSTLKVDQGAANAASVVRISSEAGASAYSLIDLLTDESGTGRGGSLAAWSSTYTTTSVYDLPSSASVYSGLNATNGLGIATYGNAPIKFYTNTVAGGADKLRWEMQSTGHLIAPTDNALDIGASGATRPRSAYIGTNVLIGTPTSPPVVAGSLAAGVSGRYLLFNGDTGQLGVRGTGRAANFNSDLPQITNDSRAVISVVDLSTSDVTGTGPAIQFNSTHDPSGGYEQAAIGGYREAGGSTVGQTPCSLALLTQGNTNPSASALTIKWRVLGAGHLIAHTDNAYDIGASGATRPRRVYVGTEVVVGDTITIDTDSIDANGALALGGTTATSLAIGRSGITTDFPAGQTVDFTGATVTGLDLGGVTGSVKGAIKLVRTTNFSVGNGLPSKQIDWDDAGAAVYNLGGFTHDPGGANPERIFVTSELNGRVVTASASIRFAFNSIGARAVILSQFNSVGTLLSSVQTNIVAPATSSTSGNVTVTGDFQVATGDYFQVNGFQDSGGALNAESLNQNTFVSIALAGEGSSSGPSRLSQTTSIDATSTGVVGLFTVPTGRTVSISKAAVRLTGVATLTSVPTIGIGVAAGEDDIFNPESLIGLDSTSKVFWFSAENLAVLATSGQTISLGIDTAAVAGAYTIAIDLFGYEV